MKTFTKEELKKYNGKGNPVYVAYKGMVYDVSGSLMWEEGTHMGEHVAGNDLTDEIKNAPHSENRLDAFPVVGALKE